MLHSVLGDKSFNPQKVAYRLKDAYEEAITRHPYKVSFLGLRQTRVNPKQSKSQVDKIRSDERRNLLGSHACSMIAFGVHLGLKRGSYTGTFFKPK